MKGIILHSEVGRRFLVGEVVAGRLPLLSVSCAVGSRGGSLLCKNYKTGWVKFVKGKENLTHSRDNKHIQGSKGRLRGLRETGDLRSCFFVSPSRANYSIDRDTRIDVEMLNRVHHDMGVSYPYSIQKTVVLGISAVVVGFSALVGGISAPVSGISALVGGSPAPVGGLSALVVGSSAPVVGSSAIVEKSPVLVESISTPNEKVLTESKQMLKINQYYIK